MLSLPEAPTNRLLIAIRGNVIGDCSSLFPTLLQYISYLKLPFGFCVWSSTMLEGSFSNDSSIELAILHNGKKMLVIESVISPLFPL